MNKSSTCTTMQSLSPSHTQAHTHTVHTHIQYTHTHSLSLSLSLSLTHTHTRTYAYAQHSRACRRSAHNTLPQEIYHGRYRKPLRQIRRNKNSQKTCHSLSGNEISVYENKMKPIIYSINEHIFETRKF
jgi:hypothetical protein